MGILSLCNRQTGESSLSTTSICSLAFSLVVLSGSLSSTLVAVELDAQAHARQSYDHLRQGQLTEAEREIRESIRLAPDNPLYHSALAGILHRSQRFEECAVEYSKAFEALPDNSPGRQKIGAQLEQVDLELGAELAKNGRYKEGLSMSSIAAQRFRESAALQQMLGFFQTKQRMNVAAVGSYTRALSLDPSSAEASLGLGMAQSGAGMYQEAIATLEAGANRFPNKALHLQALGVVLLESGDRDRAVATFEEALKLDPTLGESHLQLGNTALDKGDLRLATEHLRAAAASTPSDSRVHFALARLYRRTGDREAADREMKAWEDTKAVRSR